MGGKYFDHLVGNGGMGVVNIYGHIDVRSSACPHSREEFAKMIDARGDFQPFARAKVNFEGAEASFMGENAGRLFPKRRVALIAALTSTTRALVANMIGFARFDNMRQRSACRSIELDALAGGPTQKFVDRHTSRLAGDIP